MKPRDVHREITPRQPRTSGDGPNIGRVSRLRQSGDNYAGNQPSRRRSSRRENAAASFPLKFWSIVLGTGAFVVLVAAFFMWLKPMLNRAPVRSQVAESENDLGRKIASKFPSPTRDEAVQLVKDALSNRDVSRVDNLFRRGSVTPEDVVAYCAASDERDGKVRDYEWMSSLYSRGFLIEGVVVNYESKAKPLQRLALLTPDETGRWRLDFDAFARTVKPAWDELINKGAKQALIRVMTAPDVYYNGPFTDEAVWKCYALSSPDNEELLRGYCKVGSPQAEVMEKLFVDGSRSARVTLEIRRVEDGEPRQFEITNVLGGDWIIPGKDGADS